VEEGSVDILSNNLPAELRNFLLVRGGHSLIIRGNAGTGKTTLALQLIEELAEIEDSYYFSTRVSDAVLLNQFPWLSGHLYGNGAEEAIAMETELYEEEQILAALPPMPAELMDGESQRLWLNKLKLRGAFDFDVRPGQSFPQNRIDLTEMEKVYSTVERAKGGKSLVVIDSVDALAEACGVNPATVITCIQKDLVEGRKVNIIFVAESNDRFLDYLGDGVVELSIQDHHRRRLREMNILKLRGCSIQQPKYLFSLNDGKVRTFSDRTFKVGTVIRGWHPISDAMGKISFGMGDLDRLTEGGMTPGSIVLIELGYGVPLHVTSILEQVIVANFISHRRGVLWVPLKKESADSARQRMSSLVAKENFDRYVRVPEAASEVQDPSLTCIMRIEGTNAQLDLSWKTVAYSLKEASTPLLSLMGFDTLESIYGAKIMDQLTDHFAAVKRNRGLFIGLVSPSTKSTDRLADLATCQLKVDRIGGAVVVYGEEPFTECNVLTITDEGERTKIDLVPIV
jgi:KaiC/GvpD/RAD55 family RecA-like ATPase